MPRFYLHLRQDESLYLMTKGYSWQTLRRPGAKRGAREVLAEAIKAGKDTVVNAFVIADECWTTRRYRAVLSRTAEVLEDVRPPQSASAIFPLPAQAPHLTG